MSETADYTGVWCLCQERRQIRVSKQRFNQIPDRDARAGEQQDQQQDGRCDYQLELAITVLVGWRERALREIRWWCVSSHDDYCSCLTAVFLPAVLGLQFPCPSYGFFAGVAGFFGAVAGFFAVIGVGAGTTPVSPAFFNSSCCCFLNKSSWCLRPARMRATPSFASSRPSCAR